MRILFVTGNLASGGAQKSLISLMQCIDYKKHQVDLYLFNHNGLFLDLLPEEVHLLPEDNFWKPMKSSVLALLKKVDVIGTVRRIMFSRYRNKDSGTERANIRAWNIGRQALSEQPLKYDAAIAYGDGFPLYYIVDKVKADKKIAWNHTDYSLYGDNVAFDSLYFEKCASVVTISDKCADVLRSLFPEQKDKIRVIENIISKKLILKLMTETSTDDMPEFEGTNILTVGRLAEQKGYDLALETLAKLKKDGYRVRWYSIGIGSLKEQLIRKREELGLSNDMIFMGERTNPYKYMQKCDIYVQTSRVEGKPIAIEEAKMVGRPIVTTSFPTLGDQIIDGENGLVAEMSGSDIANKIEYLIGHPEIQDHISDQLINNRKSNEEDVIKDFYQLIGA